MTTTPVTLSDSLRVASLTPTFFKANAIGLSEVVVVGNQLDRAHSFNVTFTDRIAARAVLRAAAGIGVRLRDALSLQAILNAGHGMLLASGLRVTSKLTANQALQLRDNIRLTALAVIQNFYGMALRDAVRLGDAGPTLQLGGLLRDNLRVAANLSKIYRGLATVADELGVHDVLGHTLVAVVTLQAGVALSGQAFLQGLFHGTLSDTLQFVIDTIDPSGDVTTWVMNTRTGAVTEYMDFDFNSFAKQASGTYLGANADGLYELVGDSDAGQPIVVDLISGRANFGGIFLSGFKAAYLGLDGRGQFYLKLTAGDGKSYTYGVQASDLRTSRVNIGKGLRAKYFTWQLTSTGQDFNLNDITFLPLQATRRV